MNRQLSQLSKYLQQQGFLAEAQAISSLNQTTAWQKVLDAIEEPLPDQIITSIQYLKDGMEGMVENMQKMKDLPPDDLKALVEITSKTKPNQLNKSSQAELMKSLWSGTKFMGKRTLQVLPFVGFAFAFLIALKNFIYAFTSFAKLVKDSEQVGLTWLEVLIPSKLEEKINTFKNNPDKMLTLVRLIKYAQAFVVEGVLFVTNDLDFVKDVIFLFLDFGSFGWLLVADISVSTILMVIQYLAESSAKETYEIVLNDIKTIATSKLQAFKQTDFSTMQPEELNQWFLKQNQPNQTPKPTDFSNMDPEDLNQWFLKH